MKLAELCLGKWYYEAAMIFRNSLLLSTLLTNLESWYSCTAKDMIDLEKIVKYYWGKKWMRQPKHQLRLYTWNWEPRLLSSFSWWGDSCTWTTCHMMKEDEDSMLYRVLQSQIDNPGKGDWVHLMRQDIQDLNPNQMFENIARMLNIKWKPSSEKLSRKKKEAFKYLSDIQAGHTKTRNLRYSGLQLQSSLRSTSIKQKAMYFKLRSRMIEVHDNFKTGNADSLCRCCQKNVNHKPTCSSVKLCGTRIWWPSPC